MCRHAHYYINYAIIKLCLHIYIYVYLKVVECSTISIFRQQAAFVRNVQIIKKVTTFQWLKIVHGFHTLLQFRHTVYTVYAVKTIFTTYNIKYYKDSTIF